MSENKDKTGQKTGLVSLSGGMDSATVLAVAIHARGKENIKAVSYWYGAKHNPHELECARELAEHFGVEHDVLSVSSIFYNFESALMNRDVPIPEGHYEEENMKQTIVPNRNMIFLSILAGLAMSDKMDEIWLGVHAGDHHIYDDCRPEFVNTMRKAIKLGTGREIELITPFLNLRKDDILRVGMEYGVPYVKTRTCYTGNAIACGKCGSCCERREAFALIGQKDPIEYEYDGPLPTKG